jgi:hypothetical protein
MLETCRDIFECESTLQQHLPSIRLLGQLPLTDNDLERVFAHIQRNLGGTVNENLPGVIENTPTILACYLVWKGIQDYDEGTYWISLSSELGRLDTNQQIKLGRFFREFIGAHDLLSVEIPGSLKNITPILLHGIIPRAQVTQFFDQVVYPLVRKELVNPRSKYELAFWLENRVIAAKRAEQLEALQKKLKRLEEAEKPMGGLNLSQLDHKIRQIEEQIVQEEANLANLQTELNKIHYNPTALTGIEEDLKTVQRLGGEYEQGLRELAEQKHALDEKQSGFQQYISLGIDEPLTVNGLDAFRHAAYTTIIETMTAALDNPEEPHHSGAHILLAALFDAVAGGSLSLPDDLVRQLEVLRSTHEITEDEIESPAITEDDFCSEENTPTPPEPEAATDTELEAKECSDESLPPHSDVTAPAPSDDVMDPDITSAHVQASGVMMPGSGLALYLSPSVEDEDLILMSRYAGLHDMYQLEEHPDNPCSDADTPNQEDKELTDPEVTTYPTNDRIPGSEDSSLSHLPESGCTGSEVFPPPAEDALPVHGHDIQQETSTKTDPPAVNLSESGRKQPFKQEVTYDLPEELVVQSPLEPEVPSVLLEPESPKRYAEDTLQPRGPMIESTSRTRTAKSRNQQSPQAESQTTGAISAFIDAIIDTLSQFLRGLRR